MDEKVRIALIGFGGMGKIYAQMIYAGMVPGMKLNGVCCRNEEGRQLLKEKLPGVAVYADAEEMADHDEDFDAVLIVTPHTSHIPLGYQFAKLGKHTVNTVGLFANILQKQNLILRVNFPGRAQ